MRRFGRPGRLDGLRRVTAISGLVFKIGFVQRAQRLWRNLRRKFRRKFRRMSGLSPGVGDRRLSAEQSLERISADLSVVAADEAREFGKRIGISWIGISRNRLRPLLARLRLWRGCAKATFELIQIYFRTKLGGILTHGAPSLTQCA
jgi:hypothetical protein